MGETSKGSEDWPDWVWCVSGAGVGAWVPLPFLEKLGDGTARALEDYSSRELDAEKGDEIVGERETCGWVWCIRERDGASGWVPREKLEQGHLAVGPVFKHDLRRLSSAASKFEAVR